MTFTDLPETDTLAAVQFRMDRYAPDGQFLVGREAGQQARSELEREIAAQPMGGEPVAIDFAGVVGMSVPFADGFFVPLLSPRLSPGYYDEHPIVVIGADPDVSETLELLLRQRSLAIVSLQTAPYAELLGGESALSEALDVAARLGEFSANELAEQLGLTAQAANNRLKQLFGFGALTRVAVRRPQGGREFRYRVPRPTSAE
jgi:hypothetical protein